MVNVIGLRVYQIKLFKQHVSIPVDANKGATDVLNFVRRFQSKYSSAPFNNGVTKTFKCVPSLPRPNTQDGVLRYGTYGFATDIEDVATGTVLGTKTPVQADTIPIYFRFWSAPGTSYALMGIQSYGSKSCVDLFINQIRSEYTHAYADYTMTFKKLIPNDKKLFGNHTVKKIELIKRSERAASLKPNMRPDNCDLVNLELAIRPQKKGTFGKLKDLDQRLQGVLSIDGIDFDGAFGTIQANGKTKKVGVLGLSSSAGVIDVSNEVNLNADRHPDLPSISRVFEAHMADFARDIGP